MVCSSLRSSACSHSVSLAAWWCRLHRLRFDQSTSLMVVALAEVEGDRGGAEVEHLEGVAVAGGEEEQALGLEAGHPALEGEAGEEGLQVDAAVEVAD
ncbi:MAG: hypothetical protein IPO88_06825 [Nannocystis sp.]|uniref:hypothetical protein n=1 Tax=Nannocystis sp. TaxID=1962667 RepID=UPI0024216331|nr:hypothetical protein [Nannocystis sp.]MBK9753210.1 hypothetical protein [Nannocystis sp.]